ncbi:ureidoglycolate hydrolase [Globomyces pollinis-pini]|nr:ureidoglycolate hydrolase [Globomyces pollinis-pini]
MKSVTIQPLNRTEFADYGHVIDVPDKISGSNANYGTATRFNHLTSLVNKRISDAIPNLCIFRVKPASLPFNIKLLERHNYSSQMFIPMTSSPARYLVVVAKNDPISDKPDFNTLKVFLASSTQAFNYHPGTWHHPMIGLDSVIDFVCLVHEASNNLDCEEVFFSKDPWQAVLPSSKL